MITIANMKIAWDRKGEQLIQFCPSCGAEYSANPADYWDCSDDTELECECGDPIILVLKNPEPEYEIVME